MGSGASNQVRSNDVENISPSICSAGPGKTRPSSSSSAMSNNSFTSRKEQHDKRKKKDGLHSSSNVSDSNREATANKDVHTSTSKKSQQKSSTLVVAANISQLSPEVSTKTQNAVSGLSKAELMEKLSQTELQLAESESQRLEAIDQLQLLEERLKSSQLQNSVKNSGSHAESDMSETIHAKDQLIVKLEKDLRTSETEAKTTRLKLKRRIKALTSRLQEVRQESSIGQMELKGEITQLKEQLRNKGVTSSSTKTDGASARSSPESQSKLIVELSNQMTEQSERIAVLENQLTERDAHIQSLQSSQLEQRSDSVTGDRLRSSRGTRNHRPSAASKDNPRESPLPMNGDAPSGLRPSYSRQSTALSDSDSDWDMDEVRPHTRSAPARSRVKSAVAKKPVAKAGGVYGDDDSLMQYINNNTSDNIPPRDAVTSEGRTHPHKKSALRNHLEKKKNENQTNSLMGPSLAFSPPGQDPPDETPSCEPTPRYKDNPSRLPGFSNLTVVQAVNN